jgi:hypothetical protein
VAEPAELQAAPDYDPAKSGRTLVISLDSPASDGGAALEGSGDFLTEPGGEASTSFELVSKGVAGEPRAGRLDSGWGRPKLPSQEPITLPDF